MRNKATPENIDKVLILLGKAWKEYPHQRLGQVLLNISRNVHGETDKNVLWNMDEDELIMNLEDLLKCGWE